MALRREYGQAARVFYGIMPFSGSPGRYNPHSPLVSRSRLGTIGKNHIQSSSSFSQNCSFVCSESDTFLITIGKNHIQSSSSFSQNCSFVCSESDTFLMNYTTSKRKLLYPCNMVLIINFYGNGVRRIGAGDLIHIHIEPSFPMLSGRSTGPINSVQFFF